MIRTLILTLSFALLASGASAQKLDPSGKCHDATGKFAKASVCAAVKPAAPAHCRDIKTKKFAKCDAPGTEPVPAKK